MGPLDPPGDMVEVMFGFLHQEKYLSQGKSIVMDKSDILAEAVEATVNMDNTVVVVEEEERVRAVVLAVAFCFKLRALIFQELLYMQEEQQAAMEATAGIVTVTYGQQMAAMGDQEEAVEVVGG